MPDARSAFPPLRRARASFPSIVITGDGASGGALMFDRDYSQIGAILVGWRSNHPFSAVPFARTHYNFAVTMEGDFRKAVLALAGNLTAQK